MFREDWLDRGLKSCPYIVVASLHRKNGLQTQRAADLAEEGTVHAHHQALVTKPAWSSEAHCRNWLVRTAKNWAIDQLRKQIRQEHLLGQAVAEGRFRPRETPLAPFLEVMADLMKALPPEDRQLLESRYYQGMSLEAIAVELEVSLATVWRREKKLLQWLQDQMHHQEAVPQGWERPEPGAPTLNPSRDTGEGYVA